jgi:hypothetical protein
MSLFIALLTGILAFFFLNLFFQLAKVEKGLQGTVALLEKFMILRYNLKKDGEGDSKDGSQGETKADT